LLGLDLLAATVTMDVILEVDVVGPELVAQREPSSSQIVVPGKQLYFVGSGHHQIYEGVYLIWLLTLLPNICKNQVV